MTAPSSDGSSLSGLFTRVETGHAISSAREWRSGSYPQGMGLDPLVL